jgi:nucleoside-diphosphate-sugar epimerase
MFEHRTTEPVAPKRVVVMGAGGFVGSAIVQRLKAEGVAVVALMRRDVDLLDKDAVYRFAAILRPDDTLVFISAVAPCKDNTMLLQNVTMMASACEALEDTPVAHVIYISSDAVYADSPVPLTEDSCAGPASLHGAMHCAREVMLKTVVHSPLAILRPSLLYGAADTHNGYGPNQFRRLAAEGHDIVLFGEGEERRDHVFIDDVAEIVRLATMYCSTGVLNVATGDVFPFREVAEMVAANFSPRPAIRTTPRKGPMPHGGYRAFDSTACCRAFPRFRFTPLSEGLAKAHRDMTEVR